MNSLTEKYLCFLGSQFSIFNYKERNKIKNYYNSWNNCIKFYLFRAHQVLNRKSESQIAWSRNLWIQYFFSKSSGNMFNLLSHL